jgi:hypothetical protein
VATTVALWRAEEAERDATDKAALAEKQRGVADRQRQLAQDEAAAKERQRQLAEQRLNTSIEAVGLFANDARVFCEDALVPGASRKALYEVLIAQLEKQVQQDSAEASVDAIRLRLWMYWTISQFHLDLGQTCVARLWNEKA